MAKTMLDEAEIKNLEHNESETIKPEDPSDVTTEKATKHTNVVIRIKVKKGEKVTADFLREKKQEYLKNTK